MRKCFTQASRYRIWSWVPHFISPPMFKALLLGLVFWLLIHRLLRDWIYSGEVWHPTLMDLSLFVISICAALILMVNL